MEESRKILYTWSERQVQSLDEQCVLGYNIKVKGKNKFEINR